MPYSSISELPSSIRNVLPQHAQELFREAYNTAVYDKGLLSEERAFAYAWATLENAGWKRDENGRWRLFQSDLHATQLQYRRDVEIAKLNIEKRLVFGWLSVAKTKDDEFIIDHHGHVIEPEELEKAAYNFVLESRRGADMHKTDSHVATLVESVIFTKEKMAAMGIPEGALPYGHWTGWHVPNDEVWKKITTGKYKMLSFGGTATMGEEYEPKESR